MSAVIKIYRINKPSALFFGYQPLKLIPLLISLSIILLASISAHAQTYGYQSGYPAGYIRKSAFQQEIARLEINVERKGQIPLPISLVPRVRKDDIVRIKMLDEPINGIKPDESFWDWTLTVAFVNPSRNEVEDESVSREIRFRQEGWYREYKLKVPYDSQPVFFLYPKPKYRKKIKKLISKNFGDIKKIGEKTLEIAGAYAQIGMFLNQLQQTINQNPYGYGGYSGYNNYGSGSPFGEGFMRNQFVERLAQSFNIALPSCWQNGNSFYGTNDFVSRAQCVAKNVRLEDFDLSVGRMLQQGGLLAATKLVEKYPQLAYWINVAAAAADLIIKILKKTPLKIVPTLAQSRGNNQNNYNSQYNSYNNGQNQSIIPPRETISLFAERPPTDNDFVTAFPIVMHKWQAEPDPEVITLPVPTLLEPCLHLGQNVLKNTDLGYDWLRDPFTRDFRLVMSADNGFSREFRLTKNLGISGWMLLLNPEDTQAFPKIRMKLEASITATRGFSKVKSRKFTIPISGGGDWEVSEESISEFSVGGKRRIVVKNSQGSTRCLQSVKYKPSFGGEFTFIANATANPLRFNRDGTEAWFEIDTTHFQPGQGTLEFRAYGNNQQPQNKQINLYAAPPEITNLGVHKGDKGVTVEGQRIEQITALVVDGKPAVLDNSTQNNQPPGNTKKVFLFQNPDDIILSKTVSLELSLVGNRQYKYPKKFEVKPARPAINVDEKKEIAALVVADPKSSNRSRFDLKEYPVVPVATEKMTVSVKSILADYGFKAENTNIETRIENGQVGENALPQPTFEVLDSFNLRINFTLSEQHQQFLAGRRLQFRIKDRVRGDSDWYTIKQTFVRIPEISSVICKGSKCKVSGKGLDYIGQVSTDGGNVWQPPLTVQPTSDGRSYMEIQGVKDRRLLRIKLRDFQETEGLPIK
ncbi:MAG: hypothetical protein HKN25_13050 [Pyrinomonadaceae bacterium]|nr:hypothetical protein [Pyrinomonadaceae bacterium]